MLLAPDGSSTVTIAERVGVSTQTVSMWKTRDVKEGVDGLADRPRPGRAPEVDALAILAATLATPPAELGVFHGSSRLRVV